MIVEPVSPAARAASTAAGPKYSTPGAAPSAASTAVAMASVIAELKDL
jgi:hypothetical protein